MGTDRVEKSILETAIILWKRIEAAFIEPFISFNELRIDSL